MTHYLSYRIRGRRRILQAQMRWSGLLRRPRNALCTHSKCRFYRAFSWQAPGAYCLAQLLKRGHIAGERLPVGQLGCAVAALGIEIVEEAGCAALIGVLADIPRILRLF